MALKLTVDTGDKITVGDDIVIDVNVLPNGKVRLDFNAPRNIRIFTIFKDINKQFKNRRKKVKPVFTNQQPLRNSDDFEKKVRRW